MKKLKKAGKTTVEGEKPNESKLLLVPVFIGAILPIFELLFKPVILLKIIHFKLNCISCLDWRPVTEESQLNA